MAAKRTRSARTNSNISRANAPAASSIHEYNLLENGIDFIRSGIETFFLTDTPDPRAHKYAVLHLFSGVALLLKERLRREHESLIFERVEDHGREHARTVTFEQSIARLRACASVNLPANTLKRLSTAKNIRDSLEHHRVELNLRQTQAVIGQMAEFAYEFMNQHLTESLPEHLSGEAWRRIQHLRTIAKHLEAEELEWHRGRRRQYARMTVRELAELKRRTEYHPKDNPDAQDLLWCSRCSTESLVVAEDGIAVCTNPRCRKVRDFQRCLRCGEPAWGLSPFCDSCNAYIDAQ